MLGIPEIQARASMTRRMLVLLVLLAVPAAAQDTVIRVDQAVIGDLTVSGDCTGCSGEGSGATRAVGITLDGGGSAIATGVHGFVQVPFAGTITKSTLLSTDASATTCSIVIDVWKDTFANYPPTNTDSITASAPPTLSTDNEVEDATLTGWTTSVSAGNIIGFNVDSGDCTKVTLMLTVEE